MDSHKKIAYTGNTWQNTCICIIVYASDNIDKKMRDPSLTGLYHIWQVFAPKLFF